MKQVPLALKRSCVPTTPQSKCHPLCEGKGEREDAWRGLIILGDKKEHKKRGPLGSFCHVLSVVKKYLHVTPWKFFPTVHFC